MAEKKPTIDRVIQRLGIKGYSYWDGETITARLADIIEAVETDDVLDAFKRAHRLIIGQDIEVKKRFKIRYIIGGDNKERTAKYLRELTQVLIEKTGKPGEVKSNG
jgi:uncharacterized protein YqgV (UPF0045/DUF77 family)